MFSAQWGCFLVCRLYSSEVIIRHPVLNPFKWTHKLQSLNQAQLLRFIWLCGKGQRSLARVPAAQIIPLAFYEVFLSSGKNQKLGKLYCAQQQQWRQRHRIRCGHSLCFLSSDILNAVFKVCVVGCLLINHSGCPEGKQTGRLSPVKGPKCSCPLRAATMERLCKRRHQWLWQAWQTSLSGGRGGGSG